MRWEFSPWPEEEVSQLQLPLGCFMVRGEHRPGSPLEPSALSLGAPQRQGPVPCASVSGEHAVAGSRA